jgi:putative transposase
VPEENVGAEILYANSNSVNDSRDKQRLEKNKRIAKARMETIARHRRMTCKTYELKVDKSHLFNKTLRTLRMLFLEAKWFYNDMLARGDVWNANYKRIEVLVRNKDKEFETRRIRNLSSRMRQGVIERAKHSILSLSTLKKNGHRVGALKFKSRLASIPLMQYDSTHWTIGEKYVHIQNVKQHLKVMGLKQIPEGAELTIATLEQKDGDYFLHITTFQPKVEKRFPMKSLGVDFGIDKQLTLSTGLDIKEGVLPTKRISRIHRELSRRKRYGKNYQKTLLKLNKEYGWQTNQRTDIKNKIVSRLTSTYETISVQDDNIRGWQKMWGRRIQASAIGGIMSALKKKANTLVVVPRFIPTTKTCSSCGTVQEVGLEERIYQCRKCRLVIDRNLNSSINIRNEGVPTERREFTPVDTKAATGMMEYFNSILGVSASLVEEAGSPPAFSVGSSIKP